MDLIERLEQVRDHCVNRSLNYEAGVIQSCINITKQHSDWVSIDKQLPSDRGYFLVRLNTGEITVDYYDYDNGHWSKNYGNVTHFMRLPQPPSEVQDE